MGSFRKMVLWGPQCRVTSLLADGGLGGGGYHSHLSHPRPLALRAMVTLHD